MIQKKIYFNLGGGLGDAIHTYLTGDHKWGYLKSLKEAYPTTQIKVMASTHNPQSLELVKYNPYIDRLEEYGWQQDSKPLFNKNKKGYTWIKKEKDLLKNLYFEKPSLYLNKQDNEIIKEISSNPYIFIHPFAGLKERESFSTEKYIPIIDTLIYLGYKVVVVGGTYDRKGIYSSWSKEENFSYKRNNLFNLINKTNVRVAIGLIQKATGFIGTWSCYSCTAWLKKKKSLVLVPLKQKKELDKRFKKEGKWHNRGNCKTIFTNENTNISDIQKSIIEFYG